MMWRPGWPEEKHSGSTVHVGSSVDVSASSSSAEKRQKISTNTELPSQPPTMLHHDQQESQSSVPLPSTISSSSPSASGSCGIKRKPDDDSIGDSSKSLRADGPNLPTGVKRQAEGEPMHSHSSPDDQMTEWLDELVKISDETEHTVLVLEPGYSDLAEIFSPPRIVTIAKKNGLAARWSFDRLVEKEAGVPWDLTRRAHQMEILRIIEDEKPQLVIGSPPCSHFSKIMALNWPKTPRHKRRAMMREARDLLEFASRVYMAQYRSGRLFVHEHPESAQSWREPCMERLANLPGVVKARIDMCAYGLKSADAKGEGLVLKPTTILTNSTVMGEKLAKRCTGGHRHVRLKGGNRCSRAAIYTVEFCEAVVAAYKAHQSAKRRKDRLRGSLKARDNADSILHNIEIAADDESDCPDIFGANGNLWWTRV